MILTCECGYETEKGVKLDLTCPRKDMTFNWVCDNCDRFHIIKIELIKSV